jgi:tetratricopeptide (TPR) repeat protein
VGEVKVKGKEHPIKAYKVLGPRRIITRIEACQDKGLSPFVGRNLELDTLNACLEKVKGGHGQVIGVMGEPGVGKSRLVSRFRESLPAEEYTCIEGGCIHFGDTIPYLPILDMLRNYFDISEDENETTIKKKINDRVTQLSGQLDHILSPLHEVLSLKVEDEEYVRLDAKQRHDRVFEAIRLLLIAESQMKPLIITVEDLHWMDKTSEEFLSYLINSLAGTRIMLILLFRPEYNSGWSTKTFYSQIRVDQLPRRTIEDLVTGILGGSSVDPELCEFISNRTEGNPLFIEELTQNLMENGSITKAEDRYLLSLKPSDIQVPATVQGIIAARLDRLEGTLKGIMQVASVIGREFAFRILQALASLREDLKSSLQTLQDLEFIYEKTIFPELEYIFKHALTQEVAYNSLLFKKRKNIHERVGQAIEQIYKDRLEEFYEMLAYHYSLSENLQKAYQYLKLSGDKAAQNYSNWEAVRFYKDAIRVLDSQPENMESKKDKIQLSLSIMNPWWGLGYPEGIGAQEVMQEAERLAQELGDERSLTKVYSRLGHYHSTKGNVLLGMEYAEKCFNLAEKIEDIDLMVLIARDVCAAQWFAGNALKVVDIGSRALRLLEEHHKEKESFGSSANVYSQLSGYCGIALGFLGEIGEGKAVLEKGLRNALEVAKNQWAVGWVELNYSVLYYFEGDGLNTIDHAQKAIKYLEEARVNAIIGYAWTLSGVGYYLLGEYETARDYAEKGLKTQKEVGLPIAIPYQYWVLALIHLAAGDLEHAKECAEKSLKLSQDFSSKATEGWAWIGLGSIKGKADPTRIDEVQQNIRHGISILEERKGKLWYTLGYLFLGELLADAGRKDEALENLKKAESLYLEMKVTPKSYWLNRTREALAKLEVVT